MKKLISLLAAALLILLPVNVQAWGVEGHEVVAALAESMLSDAAKAGVQSVLGNVPLYTVANWADQIRSQRDGTYNWHFVDIPRSASGFLDSRDCFLPTNTHAGAATDHMNCVVDRIAYFKQVLANPATQPTDRQEALKFIVHFVGDVHQPFHAIGDELGGNLIHITEFGSTTCGTSPCNLHSAWDTGMIMHTGMNRDAYVQHLQQLIASNHIGSPPPPPSQGTGVATRNVNLRPDPSTSHKALETQHKGDQVTLLEASQTNGFYHVQAADGKQGWVYGHYVKLNN